MPVASDFDVRWYRAVLLCCPEAFRREFGPEMLNDVRASLRDAADAGGRAAVPLVRLRLASDLLKTTAVQWWRTGWPIIGLLAMVLPLVLSVILAAVMERLRVPVVTNIEDAQLLTLELIICTSLLVVASTIAITLSFARPRRVRRRV